MSLKLNFRIKKKPTSKQKNRFTDKLMDLGAVGFIIWIFTMTIGLFLV